MMKFFLVSAVVSKLANDENCDKDDDCESGNCSMHNNYVCKAKKELGETCLFNTDCVSERCSGLNGLQCMEKLEKGKRCVLNEDCQGDLFCNWFDERGTCSDILRVNDRCMKDEECETKWCSYVGLENLLNPMTCQYKKRDGEVCIDSNQCESGYCGEGFTCAERKEIGEGCFRNTDCKTLNCMHWSLPPWKCGSEDAAMVMPDDAPITVGEDLNV